jgi:hypothetical protein
MKQSHNVLRRDSAGFLRYALCMSILAYAILFAATTFSVNITTHVLGATLLSLAVNRFSISFPDNPTTDVLGESRLPCAFNKQNVLEHQSRFTTNSSHAYPDDTGAKAGVVVTGGDAVDFDGILVFPSAALGQDYNGQAFARVLTEDKEATNTVVTQCTKLLENYPKTYFAAVKKTVSPEDFAKFKKCIASADMNGEYSDRFLFAPIYDEESWTIPTHPCHLRIGILLTPHCKQLPSNHRAARFKSAFTRSQEQPILEAAELHSLIRPQCGLTPQIRHNSLLSTATGSAPESR